MIDQALRNGIRQRRQEQVFIHAQALRRPSENISLKLIHPGKPSGTRLVKARQ